MKQNRQSTWTVRAAFTLVELLMVVAIVSTLSAGAIFGISNITTSVETTKLQRDVAVINRAIRTYMVNGGTFLSSDLRNPAAVLAKLKTRATKDSAKQLAGLRNSMTDERLSFEMQSSGEAQNGAERARFVADPANPRFEIQDTGAPGIRRFVLDASLAGRDFGTEERSVSMKLAKTDPWVWDYSDSPIRRGEPGVPPTLDPTMLNPNPPDQGNLPLKPPDFSIPGGPLPLVSYPNTLALLPTNPAGTSQIFYSVNSGPFLPYGGPFSIDPGFVVTGVSVSLDPDHYDDSPSSSEEYSTSPVTLSPAITFSKSGYNYFELGGEAAPGTPLSGPAGSVSGAGAVTNLDVIPLRYQESAVFRYVWTVDGSNPLSSGTAQRQPDFTGGFLPVPVPVPLAAYGTASSVTISGAVKSENAALVSDSNVVTRTLGAVSLTLRPPVITIDGRDVTLALDVSAADMPKDARIYYTTDGTDPGVNAAGNPLRGVLFTGVPFTLTGATGSSQSVNARVYAPVSYLQFFNASQAGRVTLTLPAPTEVFVGGEFVNSGGSPMRNIAKLNNSGQVDTRFNTGNGASAESLVGIVRQTAGGVMAGGDFDSMNGVARPGVVRLNANGSVDSTFNAGLTTN